jgi:hypothetical protein
MEGEMILMEDERHPMNEEIPTDSSGWSSLSVLCWKTMELQWQMIVTNADSNTCNN